MSKKAKRRIKSAQISLISLVPAGANQVTSLFKGRDGVVELATLAKMDVQGYLTTAVYIPDDVDSQGDIASKAVVRQIAHDFPTNMEGNGIDVLHDGQPVGADRARVCETFVVQKGDPRFEGIKDDRGKAIDPTGSWGVVIKIDDPSLRALYATGEWVGVSMFGSAIVEPLTKSNTKETEMDEKQMAELLKKFGVDLSDSIVTGLAKALKKEPEKKEPKTETVEKTKVEFEGDPSKPEDIEAHLEKVLFASLDLSEPKDIAKWQAHLAKKAEAAAEADDDDESDDDEKVEKGKKNPNDKQIKELEKELKKLRGASAEGSEPKRKGGKLTIQDKLAKGKERAVQLAKDGVIR